MRQIGRINLCKLVKKIKALENKVCINSIKYKLKIIHLKINIKFLASI